MSKEKPQSEIDAILDNKFAKQAFWKSPVCIAITKKILKLFLDGKCYYADEVDLDFVGEDDKNVIGSIWRQLAQQGLLRKLDTPPRRSKTRHLVFAYSIWNIRLCESWLKRFGNSESPQGTLNL